MATVTSSGSMADSLSSSDPSVSSSGTGLPDRTVVYSSAKAITSVLAYVVVSATYNEETV